MVCCNLVAKLLFILFSNNKRDSGLPTEIIANTKMCITIMFQLQCAGKGGRQRGLFKCMGQQWRQQQQLQHCEDASWLSLAVCVCVCVSLCMIMGLFTVNVFTFPVFPHSVSLITIKMPVNASKPSSQPDIPGPRTNYGLPKYGV